MDGFTSEEQRQYEVDGYVHRRGVFSGAECDRVVHYMMDLHSGRKSLEGFKPREPNEWGRTHNQHLYDPMAMELLLHPALEAPLRSCFGDEPEGVQTMYFWRGSEQRRHQDQYYLPGCAAAWIAFQDVDERNGTIWIQPGSHRGKLITQADFKPGPDGSPAPLFGKHYDDAVDELFAGNGLPELPVVASKGDVVYFHGVLIHRGGPILDDGSYRHVMANHYVALGFDGWPYGGWPRISFDGTRH
ncbi:phytanoyl-CoA dioxygenase family protein [Candidatus Poribacteria bacterium]|nr:phytanoyl-CoA dioxygenase family protein [Candidatus Poribacteria bacterium]